MTVYLSNRDGNGKTSEEGHYKFQTAVWSGSVLGSTALAVTQNSPLGMSVIISAGQFKIDTSSDYAYTGWNTANYVQTITTADPANPRITTVVTYVDKSAATSASPPNNPGLVKFMAINGVPAASPTAPSGPTIQTAVGAGNPYIILANITVPTGATTIVNANIADARTQVTVGTNLVTTNSLIDGAVSTNKLANLAVSSAKLADTAVTTVKLANNAVTAAKIETQQLWVTPAMQNSWTNYDTTYNPPGYFKDSLGIVHLRGLIKNGTNTLIFTLPVGYRPYLRILINTITASNNFCRLDITPDGQVIAGAGYSNAWMSLENIHFKADQ